MYSVDKACEIIKKQSRTLSVEPDFNTLQNQLQTVKTFHHVPWPRMENLIEIHQRTPKTCILFLCRVLIQHVHQIKKSKVYLLFTAQRFLIYQILNVQIPLLHLLSCQRQLFIYKKPNYPTSWQFYVVILTLRIKIQSNNLGN